MENAGEKGKPSALHEAGELHRRADEHLRDLSIIFNSIMDGMSVHGPDHTILDVNQSLCRMLGKTREEMIGKKCYQIFHSSNVPIPGCPLEKSKQTCRKEEAELFEPSLHKWLSASTSPVLDDAGRVLKFVHVMRDITDRKRAEEALRGSEARYRKLFEDATEGIALADAASGEILDCNQAFSQLSGYPRAELVGRSQAMLHPKEKGNTGVSRTFAQHQQQDGAVLSTELLTKDGSIRQVEIKANALEIDGRRVMQGFFRNVTVEARYHYERETILKLLRLLNDPNHTHELIRDVTGFLQQWTGCEAVGVRLRDGDDFPYFETRGFPAEFVQAENQLCLRDAEGNAARDGLGHPVLECMCGNVLCGRFDPALPFFTAKGSFWTNCTSELLAGSSEADRQGRTRNRCNGEGYESVALLALRHGDEMLGLLQFNHRAKGCFTLDDIVFLERAADYIALALTQRQGHAALTASEKRYRFLFDNMLNGFAYCRMLFDQGRPQDFVYLDVNNAFETLTGLKNVAGKKVSEVIPGIRESDPGLLETYGRVALTGVPERVETYVTALNMWFSISVYSPGKDHFVALFDVITKRKQAEESLHIAHQELRHVTGILSGRLLHAQARRPDHDSHDREQQYRAITGSDARGGWIRVVAGKLASRRLRPRNVNRDQGVRPRGLFHGIPLPAPGWDLPVGRRQ